jgi:hypothetical protein
MVAIIGCESQFRQYGNDGKPLVSRTHDYGAAQINRVHIAKAEAMGLDVVNSATDNLKYAHLLYTQEGVRPWSCSRIL